MKQYRLLTQEGYSPEEHKKDMTYQADYKPSEYTHSVQKLVDLFPLDWLQIIPEPEGLSQEHLLSQILQRLINIEERLSKLGV